MTPDTHIPVLLSETVHYLNVQPGKTYLDATVGLGGHSLEIIKAGGKILGLDMDQAALDHAAKRLPPDTPLIHTRFQNLAYLVSGRPEVPFAGILFDLGVSSLQLDDATRGFSFRAAAPLDMRMDRSLPQTAADLVNSLSETELFVILTQNAQEPHARRLAHLIVEAREVEPIKTTTELAALAVKAYGSHHPSIHPATKLFQALRMRLNQENQHLDAVINTALALLEPQGRLVIISFEETADRMVKTTFQRLATSNQAVLVTKKSITPSDREVSQNPRSRSARLRAIEKL